MFSTLALLIAAPLAAQQPAPFDFDEHLEQYRADRQALERLHDYPLSGDRFARLVKHYQGAKLDMRGVNFDGLTHGEQIDWLLFRNYLERDVRRLRTEDARDQEVMPLVPWVNPLIRTLEMRARRESIEARETADMLHAVLEDLEAAKERFEDEKPDVTAPLARRTARRCEALLYALDKWYRYHAEYDPEFTWWCEAPWKALRKELADYDEYVMKELGGLDPEDDDEIIGDPIGRNALLNELAFEMLPYTPEQLIEIGEAEFAWCDARRREAAKALGYGDDWRAAQEYVKGLHVDPGEQPDLIRALAKEAIQFLDRKQLVTVPDLCKEVWRMDMMSPERQKYTPYFTGGEVISIAYPTPSMAHEDKLMAMRGNNIHFSRATVHHELVPGHHLQGYMANRWNLQRRMFRTPFLVEGWALYWELRLWDLGFAGSPEDRIGMLFWRSHRCARIIFSLNFHLGNWTPEQCVDFLVERVGHERRNAEAEVRRSVQGGYGPLYQAAYMLGGLQLRALHRELVETGKYSERDFHDAVLRENSIPVEFIRASLTGQKLNRVFRSEWRFYDGQ